VSPFLLKLGKTSLKLISNQQRLYILSRRWKSPSKLHSVLYHKATKWLGILYNGNCPNNWSSFITLVSWLNVILLKVFVGALHVLNGSNDLSASKIHIMDVRDCVVTSNMKLVPKSTDFISYCARSKQAYNKAFLLGGNRRYFKWRAPPPPQPNFRLLCPHRITIRTWLWREVHFNKRHCRAVA